MAVKRRTLLGMLLGAGAVIATPLLPLVERVLPARVVEAMKSRRYPGPVTALRREEIEKPARWMG